MASDIETAEEFLEHLRQYASGYVFVHERAALDVIRKRDAAIRAEARAEVERLRARVATLEVALRPFAEFAQFSGWADGAETLSGVLAYMKGKRMVRLTWRHLRRAAAALGQADE